MKKEILIIDDDVIYRKIIRKILCGSYDTILTESIEEASNYICNNTPDLIIADLNLPGIEGEELINVIQQNLNKKDVPIMVISGMDDDKLKNRLFGLGISVFLTKPVDRINLKEKITNLIGNQEF